MRKLAPMGLILIFFCTLTSAGAADAIVKVTQVDPSNFPEVTLYVSVTDERGQPIAALTQDDFRLIEDGADVPIKDFAGIGEARPVDIVFVFDTTGSMEEEITGVKDTCVAFAEKLQRANRDFRLGLITFGDEIRQVYDAGDSLTSDAEAFKEWIGNQTAQGGDDEPEVSLDGLERATQMQYRPNTQKILILITDATPHTSGDGTPFSRVESDSLIERLRDEGYTVYVVAGDDPRFRRLAQETRGEFYSLRRDSDFTGIIDKIGGQIASQYRLTYISARPSYDGTRRAIEVEVAGEKAESAYLEKHLINVRSSLVIAAVFLVPLLLALGLPPLVRHRVAKQSSAATGVSGAGAASTAVSRHPDESGGGQTVCPNCGNGLRAGVRFCGRCGQRMASQSVTLAPSPPFCPSCGGPVRPGVKFCGVCGQQLS